VLRWSLEEPNGKDFRVYFEDRATGSTALLTGSGVPSGSSELVLDSQALAAPCGTLSLTQGTAPTFADETPESLGSEVPSVFDLQVDPIAPCPGGEDPPPEPETTLVDRFHHRDHLGTVRVVTDEAGWVVASLDFYPFGLQMGDGDGQTRREYTGHERDEATGLDYIKARYKAVCGTGFASPDPIFDTSLAAPTTWNRYGYVHGDPINAMDPSGNAGALPPLHRAPEGADRWLEYGDPRGFSLDAALEVMGWKYGVNDHGKVVLVYGECSFHIEGNTVELKCPNDRFVWISTSNETGGRNRWHGLGTSFDIAAAGMDGARAAIVLTSTGLGAAAGATAGGIGAVPGGFAGYVAGGIATLPMGLIANFADVAGTVATLRGDGSNVGRWFHIGPRGRASLIYTAPNLFVQDPLLGGVISGYGAFVSNDAAPVNPVSLLPYTP
jgi:RHS repeat-associated protein